MKKHVRVFCLGPIAMNRVNTSPWEDVWLRWKGKPGRTVYRAAPTLLCEAELYEDLKMHDYIRREHNEPTWYLDDDAEYEACLEALKHQPYACTSGRHPEIVTRSIGIDRAEAERMLSWWMSTVHGIHAVKFQWKKPDMVVMPTTFAKYD